MISFKLIRPIVGLFISGSVVASGFSEVDEYHVKSNEAIYSDAISAPKLCFYLSEAGCSQLMRIPGFEIDSPELQHGDKLLLSELMNLSPSMVARGDGSEISTARQNLLKTSALTLGVAVGVSVESTRYNNLWTKYSELYDRFINFEALLIEGDSGRNIVPPVVMSMGDSRSVGAGGQVFRVAEAVYRIIEQPRFVIGSPSWRDYLKLEIVKPEMPASGYLPSDSREAEIWKTFLVQGYLKGIETTHHRVNARYRLLTSHYTGMVLYHLMRDFNMISEPTVEYAHNPVLATHSGSVMAIDDSIYVLSVQPTLNHDRESWKVYPQIKRLSDIQKNGYLMSGTVRNARH